MPTVSCVITSFNNQPYLQRAIESVLGQTRGLDEIIIADDASTDGSRDFLNGLAARHREIKLIFREQNIGVAANRDLAIHSAASTFITTLDGDDIYYPEKIETELELLAGRLNAVACSNFSVIDSGDSITGQRVCKGFTTLHQEDRMRYILFRQGPLPRDMTYSKQLFQEVGGYRHELRMYEDWDLKMRLTDRTRCWEHTGQVGIGHRLHDHGLSSADRLTHLTWQLRVLTGNREWLCRTMGDATVYDALLRRVVTSMGYRGAKLVR